MRKLIGGHINRVLASSAPAVIDLHILHQQRSGISISAEDAVRRAIMHNTVAQSDVVCVVIDSAKAAARDIEGLEDVVIRQAKLDGVSATRDNRTQSVYADAPNSDLVYGRTRPGEYQVAGVSGVSIDFSHVTRIKKRRNILQLLECPRWTNLIRDVIS